MKRKKMKTNEDSVVESKYFKSVYKYWPDGKFRKKYLYSNTGKLLNVYEYNYENESEIENGKYF